MNLRIIFSDDLFSYFECFIDLDEVNNIDEIIEEEILKLELKLQENKLDCLIDRLKIKKFHIHDYTFENILLSEHDQIFYICGHAK